MKKEAMITRLMNEYVTYGGGAFRRYEVLGHLKAVGVTEERAAGMALGKDMIKEDELPYFMRVREAMLEKEPYMLDEPRTGEQMELGEVV